MSAQAGLAGQALDVDVFVHALDVADGGVDAGGDCVNLHLDGVQTTIQGGETLTCAVLVVPKRDGWGCFHISSIIFAIIPFLPVSVC